MQPSIVLFAREGRLKAEDRCSLPRIGRRTVLGLGLAVVSEPRWALAQTDPARERPKENDLLVAVDSTNTPQPLKPDELQHDGKPIMAWPMDPESGTVRSGSRLNKVLLLRLDPEGFDPETRDHAADGVVAYSAVCTHAGCDVIAWHPDRRLLECPCHNSVYNPLEDAKVITGPAPRRLPALPLKVADGRLVVAKPFTGRAGFQQM